MGTFLLGGIMGAAAVIYLNRNNKPMVFTNLGRTGEAVNKMMNMARDSMNGLNKVEHMVNEDPQLKHQVDEIIAENKKPAIHQ